MTTKDHCLSFKDKQNLAVNDNLNDQFRNLNLIQNNQHIEVAESQNVENRIISNYESLDYSYNNDPQTRQNFTSFEKSKLTSSLSNSNTQKDYGKKEVKTLNANSSTLSLHITAYENSVVATSGDSIDGAKAEMNKKKENISSIKKWKAVKEIFNGSSSSVKYAFELPRQQRRNQNNDPEVMQFKASQQLSNVNGVSSSSNAEHANNMNQNIIADDDLQLPEPPVQQQIQSQIPTAETMNQQPDEGFGRGRRNRRLPKRYADEDQTYRVRQSNNRLPEQSQSAVVDDPQLPSGPPQPSSNDERRRLRPRRSNAVASFSVAPVDNNPTPEKLKKEIMKEYNLVKKKYDQHALTDGYNNFNLDNAIPPQQETIALPEFPQLEDQENIAEFHGPKNARIQLSATVLSECREVASMPHWIKIDHNIVGKDQLYLNNFPFIDEEPDALRKKQIISEIYTEGVHGEKIGCGEHINDWILYHVSAPILKRHQWKEYEDIRRLMVSMHELFPNKGSIKDLITSYMTSLLRYDPESVFPHYRIFDNEGNFASHLSPALVYAYFETRICMKCFSFDCMFHPKMKNSAHVVACNDRRIRKNKRPCGPDCYKIVNKEASESGESNVEWNDQEKTFFDMLQTVQITNSCRISQLFRTYRNCSKTCKQVYDYAKTKEPLPSSSRDANNEKKLQNITRKQRGAFRRLHLETFNNAHQYEACQHSGACTTQNDCSCKKNNICCTKFCACPITCISRFPGCTCAPGKCQTKKCDCYSASWECDPDLCESCNCGGSDATCKNINVQRGMAKKLYQKKSAVSGIGCFAKELIQKNEYIGEYTGEIISQDEAERRGKIYDLLKRSYLFSLNDKQCIDAVRYGSDLRFINHSSSPNCKPKTLIVNGEHRIGFFALRNINADEELFFDYAYNNTAKEHYGFKEI